MHDRTIVTPTYLLLILGEKGFGECTPSLVPDSLLTIHFHKENEEICFTWLVPPPDDWSPQPSHQQILIYEVVVYSLEEPIFPSSA